MDIKNLTLGEISKVEELSGMPLAALAEEDKPKGKLLASLALVIKRREDPKFTLEQANNLTMAEITALMEGGDEAEKKS
jgi:hypothetical protein